jgi:hypothetical protein
MYERRGYRFGPSTRVLGSTACKRALARARSRMGARARVGLLPGGREAGRARCRGLSPDGQLLGGLVFFWEVVAIRYY